MRADAIRYFILAHYGGIYLDLDDVSDTGTKYSVRSANFHRAAKDDWIPCSHIRPGFGEQFRPESRTMPWARPHSTRSSSTS